MRKNCPDAITVAPCAHRARRDGKSFDFWQAHFRRLGNSSRVNCKRHCVMARALHLEVRNGGISGVQMIGNGISRFAGRVPTIGSTMLEV